MRQHSLELRHFPRLLAGMGGIAAKTLSFAADHYRCRVRGPSDRAHIQNAHPGPTTAPPTRSDHRGENVVVPPAASGFGRSIAPFGPPKSLTATRIVPPELATHVLNGAIYFL